MRLTPIFVGVVGIANAVPGFMELRKGLISPPGHGDLFGAFLIASAAATVSAVLLWSKSIAKTARARIVRRVAMCLVVSASLAVTYLYVRGETVFHVEDQNRTDPRELYVPLFPTGQLAVEFDRVDSRAAIVQRAPRTVEDWVKEQPGRLALTTGILLLLYVAGQIGLTYAMCLLTTRLGADAHEFA